MNNEVLFSHQATFRKEKGKVVVTRSHLKFMTGDDDSSTLLFAYDWKDITDDKYSYEPNPMIRLSVIGVKKPMMIALIEDAVAGTATDNAADNLQGLQSQLRALRDLVKEHMKIAAASLLAATSASHSKITDPRLIEKMHRLKLEVLTTYPVLKQRYQDCVLDPRSSFLTDDQFWGSGDSATAATTGMPSDGGGDGNWGSSTATAYGYTALTALVEKQKDPELQEQWERDTGRRRAETEATAAANMALQPGRPSAILSDFCASVNPLTGELKIKLSRDKIDHIFRMCKSWQGQ